MDTSSPSHQDATEFANDLCRDDDLGCVVRAHIRIENRLMVLVERMLADSSHLKRMNLEYDQRVSLALALGLDANWASALRAIGTLRNSFAHKLDSTLDAKTVNNLYQTLPADGKAAVHASYVNIRKENPELPLSEAFACLDPKSKFQLVATAIWTRVEAWLLSHTATHGA